MRINRQKLAGNDFRVRDLGVSLDPRYEICTAPLLSRLKQYDELLMIKELLANVVTRQECESRGLMQFEVRWKDPLSLCLSIKDHRAKTRAFLTHIKNSKRRERMQKHLQPLRHRLVSRANRLRVACTNISFSMAVLIRFLTFFNQNFVTYTS